MQGSSRRRGHRLSRAGPAAGRAAPSGGPGRSPPRRPPPPQNTNPKHEGDAGTALGGWGGHAGVGATESSAPLKAGEDMRGAGGR